MDQWKVASGEAFTEVSQIGRTIKNYSYRDEASAQRTDESLSRFLIDSLFIGKKLLYSISDLLFSLHLGDHLMDSIQGLRDQTDHLTSMMKSRNFKWKHTPHVFLVKIIEHDLYLIEKVKKLNVDIEIVFNGILTETKKSRTGNLPAERFWDSVEDSLEILENELTEIEIAFREREALCNLHHLTLEKAYKQEQQSIRERTFK